MDQTDSVVVETGPSPVGSVIWLHGLGADGHDFEPIVAELRLPPSHALRFVFPHAPIRPVTINGGMAMRAWYDIVSLDSEGRADEAGIRESSAIVDALVAAELERGVAADRIVLAGFSQGGAIALFNALTGPHEYRGLMVLSSYLALPDATEQERRPERTCDVFMAHGTLDPMVPYQAGRGSAAALERWGFDVDWHEYPIAHGVCAEEIDDIRSWLLAVYGDG